MDRNYYNTHLPHHKRVAKHVNVAERCHALICQETNRFLIITNHPATSKALSTTINVCEHPSANFRLGALWNKDINAENCIYWKHDGTTVVYTPFDDFEENYRCMLINEKAAALDKLHREIYFLRNQQYCSLIHQDVIYQEKHREALDYLSTGTLSPDSIFLESYANFAGLTLEEASNNIVTMRKFHLAALNQTEMFRMKYTNMIIEQQDFFVLPTIVSDFLKEAYEYSSL